MTVPIGDAVRAINRRLVAVQVVSLIGDSGLDNLFSLANIGFVRRASEESKEATTPRLLLRFRSHGSSVVLNRLRHNASGLGSVAVRIAP